MNSEQVSYIADLRKRTAAPFFASRNTVEEAIDYVLKFNDPGVTTAAMVLLNTVLVDLESLNSPTETEKELTNHES